MSYTPTIVVDQLTDLKRQITYRKVIVAKMEGDAEHAFFDATRINQMVVLYAGGVTKETENSVKMSPLMFAILKANDMKHVRMTRRIVSKFLGDLKTEYPTLRSCTTDYEMNHLANFEEVGLESWGCYVHYLRNVRGKLARVSSPWAREILRSYPFIRYQQLNGSPLQ